MAIIKHVGRHSNKKTAIMWKEIPGEQDMALIVYTETLPRLYHDSLMEVLESERGQSAENLSDEAFRKLLQDGRNLLQVLHVEGYIRKVPTNQVIVTVNATSQVRLDELNTILRQMKEGKEAIEKMAKMDAGQGLYDPAKQPQEGRELGMPDLPPAGPLPPVQALNEADLAKDRLAQAAKMRAEAEAMLKEVTRLENEARSLQPSGKNLTTSVTVSS